MKAAIFIVSIVSTIMAKPQYGVPPPPSYGYYEPQPIEAAQHTPAESKYGSVPVPSKPQDTPVQAPPAPAYTQPEVVVQPIVSGPQEDHPGMPYDFDWSVSDDDSQNLYSHKESSDGIITRGSWQVLLPDGRTQITTFEADKDGYRPVITYQ
ncbi:pro-resilin-like [Artemia franciscana]|uniref:Cuticle protein n=1 Tax=Artemia franciscana TaxID=6661 RepID=A0AA88HAG4_ARTSF|nr:hypothetical protein QYM36_014666 [Artemia franciscana]